MELRFSASAYSREENAAYPAMSNLRCLQINSWADPVEYELLPVIRSPEDNATIVCIIKTIPDDETLPSFMLVMVDNTGAANNAIIMDLLGHFFNLLLLFCSRKNTPFLSSSRMT